jgi:hypothetical protein
MYQFSRSLYRELASDIKPDPRGRGCPDRQRFLSACESALDRLATDRHYFAKPARTLFKDVRGYFPISSQYRLYQVIERHMALAAGYVDQHAQAGVTLDGAPLSCHATTRKGTACQRVPLPGGKYCPSHKHLDESMEATAAA